MEALANAYPVVVAANSHYAHGSHVDLVQFRNWPGSASYDHLDRRRNNVAVGADLVIGVDHFGWEPYHIVRVEVAGVVTVEVGSEKPSMRYDQVHESELAIEPLPLR